MGIFFSKFRGFLDGLFLLLAYFLLLLTFALTIITVSFLISEISGGAESTFFLFKWADDFNNLVFNFIATSYDLDTGKVKTEVTPIMLSSLVAITTILGIAGWATKWYHVKRLVEKTQTIEKHDINNPGSDDINTLATLLDEAKSATIYAGSFDWIMKKPLNERILKLAKSGNLKLVSEKALNIEEVQGINVADHKKFQDVLVTKVNHGIRLTLVQYAHNESAFCTMYHVDHGSRSDKQENMIIRSDKADGRVMLSIINSLHDMLER